MPTTGINPQKPWGGRLAAWGRHELLMPNPLAKYGNPSHPRNDRSKSPYVAPPFAPVQLGIPTGARSSVTSSRIQASTPTLHDAGRGYAVANSPPPHRASGLAAGAPRPASTAHCCSMAAAMGESFRACVGAAPTRFTAEVEVNSFEFDVGTTSFEWSGNTCPCRWARNGDLDETAAGVCVAGAKAPGARSMPEVPTPSLAWTACRLPHQAKRCRDHPTVVAAPAAAAATTTTDAHLCAPTATLLTSER